MRTASDAAPGLATVRADVTRLMRGLEGGYAFALAGGGSLEPTFEAGLCHDGGDADTGYGVDIGGGIHRRDPMLGASARGLFAHQAAGLRERDLGAFAWEPALGSGLEPSLSVTQTLGAQATGGVDALLGRETLAGLAANDDGMKRRRLEAKLGYGLRSIRRPVYRDAGARARPLGHRARVRRRLAARARAERAFVVRARGPLSEMGVSDRIPVRGIELARPDAQEAPGPKGGGHPAPRSASPGCGGETVVRLLVECDGRRILRALNERCPERTVDAGNETDIRGVVVLAGNMD